ncbi:MAG: TIGR04053 family radical SAM/SPASM domain-containing protein [Thermoplasmata archaeon]
MTHGHGAGPERRPPDYSQAPLLLFWETTRACPLSCVHCRASAIPDPLPGELSSNEGRRLLDQVATFGDRLPTVIFTGGDPLRRRDLFDLLSYARGLGLHFGVSPAVSSGLTRDVISQLAGAGASALSFSLDGSRPETHDAIRRQPGAFEHTLQAVAEARDLGLRVQLNTMVMLENVEELPGIFHILRGLGVRAWELFFLIKVGRGAEEDVHDLPAVACESVCNFLYDASRYGIAVRAVEAPFLRRVLRMREDRGDYWDDGLYRPLRSDLIASEGAPNLPSSLAPTGTLDGDGILFVAHDGEVYPGGLLPFALGNVKDGNLPAIYRTHELLRQIRRRAFTGVCGVCPVREVCGGSRARAYAASGDPLASDPACVWTPSVLVEGG